MLDLACLLATLTVGGLRSTSNYRTTCFFLSIIGRSMSKRLKTDFTEVDLKKKRFFQRLMTLKIILPMYLHECYCTFLHFHASRYPPIATEWSPRSSETVLWASQTPSLPSGPLQYVRWPKLHIGAKTIISATTNSVNFRFTETKAQILF